MIKDLEWLCRKVRGPFVCGKDITIGDIAMAPYFYRMKVLEHYRGFFVPESNAKFHIWKKAVLDHPDVKLTLGSEEKMIKSYRRYANGTIRNTHYFRYYVNTPRWMKNEDLDKDESESKR
jgi:glutathione S-transferase